MTGRVRSVSSRSGQVLCWPNVVEVPLQALKSAVALILCICAGGSDQLAHDEWRGSSSLFRKAFSASSKWDGITAAVPVAAQSCVWPTAVNCEAGSQGPVFVGIGGTHQSGLGTEGVRLFWSRHDHCCHQAKFHG